MLETIRRDGRYSVKVSELAPQIGERVFITGNTGSGKSTLAQFIAREMATRQTLLIIDPKGEIDIFRDTERVIHKPELVKNARVIRYVPSVDSDVPGEVDTMLRSCYNAGNIAIWVDELYAIVDGVHTNALTGLRAVLTRGRSKKVTFMGLAQRPAWIPLFLISEANKSYVFCLPMKEDRDRMNQIIGNEKLLTVLPKYQFWAATTDEPGEVDGPLKLSL